MWTGGGPGAGSPWEGTGGYLGSVLRGCPMTQRWYSPVVHGTHSPSGRWRSAGRQCSGGRALRRQGDGKSDVVEEQCGQRNEL